ncbi:hypothetical protein [Gimesia fumaroli]|uniref:Uncharacterized protein n=1 Tax=Gimesia fumaroli TaxID=2527976 RepID=A0A518I8V1_9PLAN|nr:hypothetical protein [Gimesia fumaroli]QDV49520.1 hypothetical protein Enr17x_15390 [Gimesia fumaroli]
MSTKAKELLKFAQELAPSISDWYSFHNALFGIHGKLGKLFKTQEEREAFFNTIEYRKIDKLAKDIEQRQNDSKEAKILVRLPESLKEQLTSEAELGGYKSVNDLCIKKLAQPVETLV